MKNTTLTNATFNRTNIHALHEKDNTWSNVNDADLLKQDNTQAEFDEKLTDLGIPL
jgi:hypothetical protein